MISVMLLAAGFFVAAILNLALDTRVKGRVMGLSACFAVISGIVFYGAAFAWAGSFAASTVFRTLLTVCRMFGGVNDFAAVDAVPFFRSEPARAAFWLGHFLAFYVTASAAIEVLGKRLLKIVRIRLLSRGSMTLAVDATPETLRLVRANRAKHSLVVVADRPDAALAAASDAMGGVVFEGGAALCASPAFLRRIGVGSRQQDVEAYFLGGDAGRNLKGAEGLLSALEARQVDGENVSLFLLGVSETKAARLLMGEGRYGCGALFACTRHELAARLAIRKLPPWTLLDFDADGRATGDFSAVIVGFGRMGQAMLMQLVMNGQFEGSAFHAAVYDPRMNALSGLIRSRSSELLNSFDIALRAFGGESVSFYEELEAREPDVILLCAGSRRENAELAMELNQFYSAREKAPRVMQCSPDGVILGDAEYGLEDVDVKAMDRRAMMFNHVYCGGPSAEADWRGCDPFSRMSCRASADFSPAYAHISGLDPLAHWPPPPETLENLGRTEHRRWCAFHLAMGYRPMGEAEFARRAARVIGGESLRVGKNAEAMTHACLVPWEALDALSERMSAVTGKPVDYKKMDVDNVRVLPEVLRMENEPAGRP